VDHKRDPVGDAQRFEEPVEVAAVLDKAVAVGARRRELLGIAHADQVGGEAAVERREVGDDVAPQV
jgi:hypothetical protein